MSAHRPTAAQAAKKQALARGEKVHMVETDWRWWSQAWADQNPYKVRGGRAAGNGAGACFDSNSQGEQGQITAG